GKDALGLFYDFTPNMVISDHQVAGLSGIEICRLLKSHPNGREAVFVLITHLPSNPRLIEELARRVQADDLVGKPFTAQEILNKANEWLSGKSRPDPVFARSAAKPEAKEPQGKPLPSKGRLSEISFPKLLFQIHQRRFSGQLILEDKRKRLRIIFHQGNPINVNSNYIREDSLGRVLVQKKKITEEQLEQANQRLKVRGGKLGEILVAMQLLSMSELDEHLQRQNYNKLLSVFHPDWRNGQFSLRGGKFYFDRGQKFSISTISLIQDGIAENFDLARLAQFFHRKERMNRVCRVSPDIDVIYGKLNLDETLMRVIEQMRRGVKIGDLEVLVHVDKLQLYQFLYALLVLRVATFDKIEDHLPSTQVEKPKEPDETEIIIEPPVNPLTSAEYNRNFYLGKKFFDLGNFDKALPHLRLALSNNPDCADSLAMVGWCFYILRQKSDRYVSEEAKEYLKRAIDCSPSCAKAYLFMAKILKEERKDHLYEQYARKAHQYDPNNPDIKREFELAMIRRRRTLS
ncbi:MAG: DUF4388 domain-containing protein, partial [Alphaproteobacteria bacterium]